ncbi:MAG TPA: PAS domain-containing protein, partial [Flavisolibacter sp.]
LKMLKHSGKDVRHQGIAGNELRFFEAIPGNNVLVLNDPPHFTIVAVTESYLKESGRTRGQLIGKGIFEAFPSNPGDQKDTGEADLRFSFNQVLTHKQGHELPTQRYDVANADGSFEERYWNVLNSPVLSGNGEVSYIIHSAVEITYQVKARQKEERFKVLEQVHNLFMQAPLAIAILTGDRLVIELANEPAIEVWGKGPDIIGQPIADVLPEIKDQGFIDLMKEVVATGKPFQAYEMPVSLIRNGNNELVYFNFVYQPYYVHVNEAPIGIIIFANDVTEQVTSKLKVKESTQRTSSLVESAPFPIGVYVGREMRIELANQTIIDIYGKGKDVIGKRYTEILPELGNQQIFDQLDDVFISGKPFHAKNQRVDIEHDGKLKTYYFNYSFTPLFDASGEIYGVMNTAADVTDLVLAKKEVELNEAKAWMAIDSAELGTYEIYLDTDEMLTSQRFQQIWGVTNTTSRKDFAAVIHPDDLAIRERAINEAYRSSSLDYEARLLQKDGSTRWVKVRGKMMENDDGKPDRIIGVIQDITEQKLFAQELEKQVKERTAALESAHERLLSANTYLQKIINVFKTPLQVLEPVMENGNVVDFIFKLTNEAYANYANRKPSELKDKKVSEFFPGYFETDSFKNIAEVCRTGIAKTWDNHYAADGLNIYNEMGALKMDNEIIVHFTDFTRLKNLQFKLEQKVIELERSNKNLEEFAYVASHDLKEPIRKIHFFTDRLKNSLKNNLAETDLGYFDRLETASKRMSSLIDDLLAYSQVSVRPNDFEEVDINQVIDLVLIDLDLEIDQKQASISVGRIGKVQGYPGQLQQAFHNLLANALKYSKPGTRPEIEIRSRKIAGKDISLPLSSQEKEKTYWQVAVADNGIGFEPEDAERIFNVFTRLHGNKEYRGTGVGLSIVRKVIENHNGFIKASGVPGEGSVFEMYLPG